MCCLSPATASRFHAGCPGERALARWSGQSPAAFLDGTMDCRPPIAKAPNAHAPGVSRQRRTAKSSPYRRLPFPATCTDSPSWPRGCDQGWSPFPGLELHWLPCSRRGGSCSNISGTSPSKISTRSPGCLSSESRVALPRHGHAEL